MIEGYRIDKDNQTLRDFVFTDMACDKLGITAKIADPKKCGCGLKYHLAIQTRGTWTPDGPKDLDDLISVLTQIRDGFEAKRVKR